MVDNVLVTGGAGYIGSHVCKALSRAGYLPISYDNLSRGFADAVKWGPLELGDIRDSERLDEVFTQYQPTAVLHFAAYAYVGESVREPDLYRDNNVDGSRCLIAAMMRHNVKTMVFSSSCTVYGDPSEVPVTESMPLQPMSPYGLSKLTIESDLRGHAAEYGLNSVALRYFNAAGCDPDGEIGESHDPETHLIPLVLMAARDKTNVVTVFGNDYPTRDGSCIRDYVHVCDLADAHVLALQYLAGNQGAFQCNLGNSHGVSVFEIIERVKAITGQSVTFKIGDRREGDVPALFSEIGLAQTMLGWTPKQSELDHIISTAWNWMQAQGSN